VDPLTLFAVMFRASILAVGGQAALPLLREDLVRTGVTTDERLVEAITVGRLSTGPSGLYIVALGFFIAGWGGALVALAAAMIPPLLIVPAAALIRPRLVTRRVGGLVAGIALTTSGLVVATSIELLASVGGGAGASFLAIGGVPVWQLALAAAGLVVGWRGRRHPLWVITAGAVAGIAVLGLTGT
jgi:chromate transporter